jgi:hypothetical protein|tara:strand:+ start:3351 stop:3707 length:357 start_codon:yes stop_codon:yes gene_type:complete
MARKLTEMQQAFLDVLFEDAKGSYVEAKKIAGYSPNVSTSSIVEALESEIAEKTKKFLVTTGVQAAWAMKTVMDNPTDLGNKEKMAAAKDFLDRAGHKGADKVEIKAESPIFILPPKD